MVKRRTFSNTTGSFSLVKPYDERLLVSADVRFYLVNIFIDESAVSACYEYIENNSFQIFEFIVKKKVFFEWTIIVLDYRNHKKKNKFLI